MRQPANYPDAETRRLDAALLDWIDAAPAGFVSAGSTRAECYGLDPLAFAALGQRFETLALELFAYQFERVQVYGTYARALGRTPASVRCARDVPALPVEALRRTRVAAFPPGAECAQFHTSGTTGAPGVLHLDTLALYDLTLARGFAHHVIPDLDRMRMIILAPSWQEMPHSSLAYMFDRVRRRWGTAASDTYIREGRLLWPELQRTLATAVVAEEPVCILGTAFALAEMLDACAQTGWSVRLPAGSRVFETGGMKGRRRELSRAALRYELDHHLGVPANHVVSEYGMTELASQYYTLSLRLALLGDAREGAHGGGTGNDVVPARPPAGDLDAELWSAPLWLCPRILDAETGACRGVDSPGDPGLLAHHDLGNRATVAHWLCADLGAPLGASFELRGRCPHADLRGCGLADEQRSATS